MQNRNYTRNEEKQIMSYNAYHLDNPIELNGWEMVCNVSEAETSFEGQIYKKDNDIVIVYKGSQEGRDYLYSEKRTGTTEICTHFTYVRTTQISEC